MSAFGKKLTDAQIRQPDHACPQIRTEMNMVGDY